MWVALSVKYKNSKFSNHFEIYYMELAFNIKGIILYYILLYTFRF